MVNDCDVIKYLRPRMDARLDSISPAVLGKEFDRDETYKLIVETDKSHEHLQTELNGER